MNFQLVFISTSHCSGQRCETIRDISKVLGGFSRSQPESPSRTSLHERSAWTAGTPCVDRVAADRLGNRPRSAKSTLLMKCPEEKGRSAPTQEKIQIPGRRSAGSATPSAYWVWVGRLTKTNQRSSHLAEVRYHRGRRKKNYEKEERCCARLAKIQYIRMDSIPWRCALACSRGEKTDRGLTALRPFVGTRSCACAQVRHGLDSPGSPAQRRRSSARTPL